MNFVTFGYVLFLLLVVGVYWILPHRARHWWLLGASLFFYGTWNIVYVPGFLVLIGFNFLMGRAAAGPNGRRATIIAVVFNLGLLGVFKYLDWVLGSSYSLISFITGREVELGTLGLILPLAISFVTFTFVAYIVDIHRGRAPERSPLRFAVFVMYFPHLVAGPIMRAREFLPQLHHMRPFKGRLLVEGGPLLLSGMLKKSMADLLAPTVADAMADPCASPRWAWPSRRPRSRSSSTWTSRATRTSPWAPPGSWASGCPRTSTGRTARPTCPSSGPAGTSRWAAGCATTSTSRWAARARATRAPTPT